MKEFVAKVFDQEKEGGEGRSWWKKSIMKFLKQKGVRKKKTPQIESGGSGQKEEEKGLLRVNQL